MGKKSSTGSGMIILNHISESLETVCGVFDEVADPDPGSGNLLTLDPGSGMEKIRIQDVYPGSATLIKV
jgi:hypothetical protein